LKKRKEKKKKNKRRGRKRERRYLITAVEGKKNVTWREAKGTLTV